MELILSIALSNVEKAIVLGYFGYNFTYAKPQFDASISLCSMEQQSALSSWALSQNLVRYNLVGTKSQRKISFRALSINLKIN